MDNYFCLPRPPLLLLIKVQVLGVFRMRECMRMCEAREGLLPSSALSGSNRIKVLLLRRPSCSPLCRAHLKSLYSHNNWPLQSYKNSILNSCVWTHTRTHTHTIQRFAPAVCLAFSLTSHHHPCCWQPLLWPPEAWLPPVAPVHRAQTTDLFKDAYSTGLWHFIWQHTLID